MDEGRDDILAKVFSIFFSITFCLATLMWRLLFFGFFLLTCFIQTQDALFTGGRSFQEVTIHFLMIETTNLRVLVFFSSVY